MKLNNNHKNLVRKSTLGILGRIRLLAGHFLHGLAYLTAMLRTPALSLIARDFAYARVASGIDDRNLIECVVVSCSNYIAQPLWLRSLRHAEVHMIWYSQDVKPVSYRPDHVPSHLPMLRWMRATVHWVWTRALANYFRDLGLASRYWKNLNQPVNRLQRAPFS